MLIKNNHSLLSHNTFGIDVKADTVIYYSSEEELVEIVRTKLQNAPKPILHIGHGSNLLFMGDFPGTVLYSQINTLQVLHETEDNVIVKAGAGITMDSFIEQCIANGWYGIENLSLIPGQVGASAVQNIGAYGVEAGDYIHQVNCISLSDGSPKTFLHEECQFSYRHSIFKNPEYKGKYAVVSVEFSLKKHFVPQLSYGGILKSIESAGISLEKLTPQELRNVIISIREEKLPDPKIQGNAGSFFMNPIVERKKFEEIQMEYPNVPKYIIDEEHIKIPAAWLIEQCEWKGRSLGPAGVHHKQPLVLVNLGGATGQDIKNLSEQIQKDVFNKFGISISAEVNFI